MENLHAQNKHLFDVNKKLLNHNYLNIFWGIFVTSFSKFSTEYIKTDRKLIHYVFCELQTPLSLNLQSKIKKKALN